MAETIDLTVKGMTCRHCVARVDKALSGVAGVESVKVDLEGGSARVKGNGIDPQALVAAVIEAGYEASPE